MTKISKLKREVQRLKDQSPDGKVRRYPATIKNLARDVIKSGVSISALEEASGINDMTLRDWSYGAKSKSAGGPFKELNVVDGRKSKVLLQGGISVTTPTGGVLRGLSLTEIQVLLKAGLL